MKLPRLFIIGAVLLCSLPLWAVTVDLQLPLGRTAYQTNETIDLAVVRSSKDVIPPAPLIITLTGTDGSKLEFQFAAGQVPVVGNSAAATEHYRLNGWLLRPGHYAVKVSVNDVTAEKAIDLYTYLRKSPFTLISWGSGAQGAQHIGEGEDGMGFNLIYGEYRPGPGRNPLPSAEATLRGGADFMQVCTMSGAHQMDLRLECDWSDPYVTRGGTARVVQQAFGNRTTPNCLGVHYYDEPGLTWWTNPKTGKFGPLDVPAQMSAYKNSFGVDALQSTDVKADDPATVARWRQFSRWKESFMDSAWKESRAGVDKVNPNYISATQSQYGWNSYTDGSYFNEVRSLPVISGHGGYDDGYGGYLYPAYHLEFGRMRDLNKPDWYVPTWYNANSDIFRLEQNMSFMVGLQGMGTPPWLKTYDPQGKPESQGVVECNKMMARLGTIFTVMPVTRGQVAMLYSLDQCIDAQVKSGMKDFYEGGGLTRGKLLQLYVAGKMLHTSFFPVVEEDILDGTLAANHRAVVITGINYLDAKVISALQGYIAGGGAVIVTDDCQVQIPGAVKLGVPCTTIQYDLTNKLWAEKKQKEAMYARNPADFMKETAPVAKALQAQLARIGIQPDLDVDNTSVFANRHVSGDFEYLFTLNATSAADPAHLDSNLAIKGTSATLTLPADGRPVYDAIHGGVVAAFKGKKNLTATLAYGPGQLRVFARTTRPIGGVQVLAPSLYRDYTLAKDPIHFNFTAFVVDNKGVAFAGTAPLQVRLIDPLGVPRYDLYRASKDGMLQMTLPLAVNDPAGKWTVEVTELLANTKGTATFTYAAPSQCGAVAGASPRALFFGNDRENIFRFVREHQDVTIIKGTSDYDAAAADRLTASLKAWGVRCTVVNAADVNKPRTLTEDERPTWVGLEVGAIKPGDKPSIYKVGFAVSGPVILVGNPTDNPLIKSVADWGFLPYPVTAAFPGRGRGYIAWQYDAVGIGQDSLTVIAADADGMSEAVGTLYEAAAGIDPITPTIPPLVSTVVAAAKDIRAAQLATAWQVVLPDRPLAMTIDNGKISVASNDGTVTVLDKAGKVQSQQAGKLDTPKAVDKVPDALKAQLLPGHPVKQVIADNGATTIAYWGGTVQVFDANNALKAQQQFPQDAVTLGWNGSTLIVALADGMLVAVK